MEAHLAPAWDVRHRVAVGFACGVVMVAAVFAGFMQQAWERHEDLWMEFFGGTWIGLST